MGILLAWTDPNVIAATEDEIRIYRDTVSFDEESLPSVLEILPSGTSQYLDESAIDGTNYFYRVAYIKGSQVSLSDEFEVQAPADGVATAGTAFDYVNTSKYFLQTFGKLPIYNSGHADSIRASNASTRKVLGAMVIIDEKLDVLDTEQIVITAADIATTSGEWLSGAQDGDIITWRGLLELMLVPSKSDVSSCVNRVLGSYLRDKYKIGNNVDQAMGYFMTRAALRAGCVEALGLSMAASFTAANQDYNSNGEQTFFTARTMATIIGYIYDRYPTLVDIMKMTRVDVVVDRGGTPTTLSWSSMTPNQHGQTGGYEIGKTGDIGTTGHEMFVFTTPSGDKMAAVTLENSSRENRWANSSAFMLALPNLKPEYRAAEVAADPNLASVICRVQGDALADIGPNGYTVAAIGGAAVQDSLFFKDKGIFLPANSGFSIAPSGPAGNIGANDFTAEAFFRRTNNTAFSGVSEIFGKYTAATSGRSWGFQLNDSTLHFWWSTDGSNPASINTVLPPSLALKNTPIHVVAQRTGGTLYLYVNGVLVATGSSSPAFYNSNSQMLVGCRATTVGGSSYTNYLSNVEVHEVSLTLGVARYPLVGFTPVYRWKRWD